MIALKEFSPQVREAPTGRRCDGCAEYSVDVELGIPTRASHLPRRARLCVDCRAYLRRQYSEPGCDPAWRPLVTNAVLLASLCAIPTEADAVDSERAWNRRRHLDLVDMARGELIQQRAQAKLRLAIEAATTPPSEALRWLTERLARIEQKLARHG